MFERTIQEKIFKAIVKSNSKNDGNYAIQALVCAHLKPSGWS